MAEIRVEKAAESSKKRRGSQSMRLLATFCSYYPAYTLAEAREVPNKHVVLMLEQAKRLESARYWNLLQISIAPHAKKEHAKKLSDQYLRESKE